MLAGGPCKADIGLIARPTQHSFDAEFTPPLPGTAVTTTISYCVSHVFKRALGEHNGMWQCVISRASVSHCPLD